MSQLQPFTCSLLGAGFPAFAAHVLAAPNSSSNFDTPTTTARCHRGQIRERIGLVLLVGLGRCCGGLEPQWNIFEHAGSYSHPFRA